LLLLLLLLLLFQWLQEIAPFLGVDIDVNQAQNNHGCNLAHLCVSGVDVASIANLKVDWRQRDKLGRTAIQCLASRLKGGAVDELMLSVTDEDFVGHCSPRVWGVVGGPLHADYSSALTPLLTRFIRLVPQLHWPELITAAIHVHLRLSPSPGSMSIIDEYLTHPNAIVQKLAWKAFFEPFDTTKLAVMYDPVQNFARHFYTKPVPHVLCARGATKLAQSLLGYAKQNLQKAELNAWITARDEHCGYNCIEFMKNVCTWCFSGDVERMKELFRAV